MWMSIESNYLLKNCLRDCFPYALIVGISTSSLYVVWDLIVGQLHKRYPFRLSDVTAKQLNLHNGKQFLGPTFWHFPPKLIQSESSRAVKRAYWSARVFTEDFAWHFKQSICVSGFRCSAEMCRKGWGPTILLTYIKGRIRWACVLLFFLHNLGSHAATYRYRMTWELLWKASSLKSSGLLFCLEGTLIIF